MIRNTKNGPKKATALYLEVETLKRIRAVSEEKDLSVTWIINWILKNHISDAEKLDI